MMEQNKLQKILEENFPDAKIILKDLVKDAENWSKTNIQPYWWHDVKTGKKWKADNMPKFDKTFNLN